ncbi:hypothetical protein [Altibacter sp.]|uniref:hypothetical protein n=1 Tax=Altibacter sp. TaxID=2024823 RepID=UPI00258BED4E|nr:hypothetical protein [Altibacter sp.]MCW9037426.1 hypothetical protein [Altibacter sp.]
MELLLYLGKSMLLLSMFYGVYRFMLQKDTLFVSKRHFLLLGIISTVLLPVVEITTVTYQEVVPPPAVVSYTETIPLTHIVQDQEAIAIYWWEIVLVLYFLGVLIMGVRFILQLASLLSIIHETPSVRVQDKRHVQTHRNIAPFSFFQYIVYNPSQHSAEELRMILKHERVHASQWHTADIIATNLVLILQWMNPLAWLYKSAIEENLEYIADSETIQQIQSKKAYQLALVRASSTFTVPALTNNFYQSFTRLVVFGRQIRLFKSSRQIKKRIIMLNKSNSKKVNVLKGAIVLPMLALFLVSFNVKEVVKYVSLTPEGKASEDHESAALKPVSNPPDRIAETMVLPEVSEKPTSHTGDPKNDDETTSILNETPKKRIQNKGVRFGDEIYILITKNTTEADLKMHQKTLKEEHNVTFTYSNVNYNAKGELTSISINIKSDGGNGNYQVAEDGPIEDFYFYISEDGSLGFGSKELEERMEERDDRKRARFEKREELLIERKKELKDRRTAIEVKRNEMRDKLMEKEVEIEERKKDLKDRQLAIVRSNTEDTDDNVFVYSGSSGSVAKFGSGTMEHSILIDKNTSDETLAEMKSDLSAKGIEFNYSKLRRNDRNEITRIRIEVDNGKGQHSITTTQTDDGQPIDDILIELK